MLKFIPGKCIDDAIQSVGISLDEKGRIPVNEQFKTSVAK